GLRAAARRPLRRCARFCRCGRVTRRHPRSPRSRAVHGIAQSRTAPRCVRRTADARLTDGMIMAHRDTIRIASGQGFWGDLLSAPVSQVRRGQVDYLMLDYLAEVTMSIMQKQHARDPAQGYARDFIPLMGEILPDCVQKNIR